MGMGDHNAMTWGEYSVFPGYSGRLSRVPRPPVLTSNVNLPGDKWSQVAANTASPAGESC